MDAAIRAREPDLGGLAQVLRRVGFHAEAFVLDAPGVLDRAEQEVRAGRVLTANSPCYPPRWFAVLGPAAPPALWMRGSVPPGPCVAVVGSRTVDASVKGFARRAAIESVAQGYAVISGGAAGCDQAAAGGAGTSLIEIAPCGLRHRRIGTGGELSVCAPDEPFSTATAMERNILVYAASELSVVAHARLKKGGTWHGATEALRRRLAPVGVRWEAEDPAAAALVGLGAWPMESAGDLLATLSAVKEDGGLFSPRWAAEDAAGRGFHAGQRYTSPP